MWRTLKIWVSTSVIGGSALSHRAPGPGTKPDGLSIIDFLDQSPDDAGQQHHPNG
jgi:hypothetical protein